ncbi:uncharacterized protein LOC142336990 [Convolutriloba macropyga]|uniref:uncharacterized protein LOC142336990 n=1 Tax=Convolutriloba macropyga TaxID=536237 RepID=UPI003F51AEBC
MDSHDIYPYTGPNTDRSLRQVHSGPNGVRHQQVKTLGHLGFVGNPGDISNESSSNLGYIFRGTKPLYQRRHERVGEVGFSMESLKAMAAQHRKQDTA